MNFTDNACISWFYLFIYIYIYIYIYIFFFLISIQLSVLLIFIYINVISIFSICYAIMERFGPGSGISDEVHFNYYESILKLLHSRSIKISLEAVKFGTFFFLLLFSLSLLSLLSLLYLLSSYISYYDKTIIVILNLILILIFNNIYVYVYVYVYS